MFHVRTADLTERDRLIAHLKAKGILAVFHYVPLHSSPYGRALAGGADELPVTDATSSTLLRLPQSGQEVAVVVLGARSNAGRFMETRHLFNWLSSRAGELVTPAVAAQPEN
jgi:dTDP-4-amino-4,6-dideoxygalactose transaminase